MNQPKFEQADLKVTIEGDGAEVDLDLDRFKQIVANLLSNSIRYTEAGGQVHIHTEQNEKEWTLYVDDSPFGLTDEQLARIGERFYRVDDSRTVPPVEQAWVWPYLVKLLRLWVVA